MTKNKHTQDSAVTKDTNGDIVNMSGTISQAPPVRPYIPNEPVSKPKHSKD